MAYFKKTIMIILLVVMTSMPIYGTEVVPTNDINQYIEIINPSITENNTIDVRNLFFVSFNIKEEAEMYLTIRKIVPVMDTIFLDRIKSGELDQKKFIDSLTRRVLEIRGFSSDEDRTDQREADDSLRENEIKDIIEKYVGSYISEQKAYEEYIAAQNEIEVLKNNFNTEDTVVVIPEAYEKMRADYKEKRNTLNESKKEYDALFKVVILDKDPIKSEGVMPYYEKTIENIQYGAYEMVVELMMEEELIELESLDLNIGAQDNVEGDVFKEKEIKLIQPMDLDELEE